MGAKAHRRGGNASDAPSAPSVRSPDIASRSGDDRPIRHLTELRLGAPSPLPFTASATTRRASVERPLALSRRAPLRSLFFVRRRRAAALRPAPRPLRAPTPPATPLAAASPFAPASPCSAPAPASPPWLPLPLARAQLAAQPQCHREHHHEPLPPAPPPAPSPAYRRTTSSSALTTPATALPPNLSSSPPSPTAPRRPRSPSPLPINSPADHHEDPPSIAALLPKTRAHLAGRGHSYSALSHRLLRSFPAPRSQQRSFPTSVMTYSHSFSQRFHNEFYAPEIEYLKTLFDPRVELPERVLAYQTLRSSKRAAVPGGGTIRVLRTTCAKANVACPASVRRR